jgi:hypothetical protein
LVGGQAAEILIYNNDRLPYRLLATIFAGSMLPVEVDALITEHTFDIPGDYTIKPAAEEPGG